MIPSSALQLRDVILAVARDRGVPLEERRFRIEHGRPHLYVRLGDRVVRGCHVEFPADPAVADRWCRQDVITVHGSGERSSKMWPRKIDGTFNIGAITNHLLHLVDVELSRPVPELDVPRGVPAARSGLHVLHLAGVRLRVFSADSKPEHLVDRIDDAVVRKRIERHLVKAGLLDADFRILASADGLRLYRPRDIDHDPFEVHNDRMLPLLKLGRLVGNKIERRHVLVLDSRDAVITVADPAGEGLVDVGEDELTAAWKLGAKKGVLWLGWI